MTGGPVGLGSLDLTGWIHVALSLAYLLVALTLLLVLFRRRDVSSGLALLVLTGLFAVGSTAHALCAFAPDSSGLRGILPATTGLVGVASAVLLWRLLPEAMTLPRASRLAREMEVRRAAEVRARLSEAQLTDLFNHLPDALFVARLCPDGSFVFENVNTAFRRLVGQPEAPLLGAKASGFMAPAAAATLERQFAEALGANRVIEHEAGFAMQDGHRIWHTLLVPIRAEGADIRLLGSIRDVTSIRRLRSDLQEASRLATVGSMCAGVAHEMSQPINIVALWSGRVRATLSRGTPDVGRIRRALEIVEDQTKRLSGLLERMRDLTDESKNEDEDIFDAGEAALGAVEMVGRQVALKGVSVMLSPNRDAIPVRGRRAQFEQALLQIVANAADAVERRLQREPDSPAQVRVTIHADAQAGEAVIEVRDTGGGVPLGLQNRIFDPFFTTKDPGQGTGLGLSIAQGAARALGGSLSTFNVAQGAPEAGAVFRLSLPLLRMRAQPLRRIA
ncbi:MAG TPA: ATP-binding protein [Acetobacteraceae bacterium]|nr:ATP-binding protein [Acetobacteraceae bacterium]